MPQKSKAAHYATTKKWRLDNPAKVKAYRKKYASTPGYREKVNAQSAKFRASHPGYSNAARQKSIRKKQVTLAGRPKPKRCEVCKRTGRTIVWDHCHQRGKFRGWICKQCNTALGCVGDSAKVLRRLADYLDQSNHR